MAFYDLSFGAPTLTFPGSLQVFSALTKEQAIEMFGTPDKFEDYSDPAGSYTEYAFTFNKDNMMLSISTVNDEISSIYIKLTDY